MFNFTEGGRCRCIGRAFDINNLDKSLPMWWDWIKTLWLNQMGFCLWTVINYSLIHVCFTILKTCSFLNQFILIIWKVWLQLLRDLSIYLLCSYCISFKDLWRNYHCVLSSECIVFSIDLDAIKLAQSTLFWIGRCQNIWQHRALRFWKGCCQIIW